MAGWEFGLPSRLCFLLLCRYKDGAYRGINGDAVGDRRDGAIAAIDAEERYLVGGVVGDAQASAVR